MKGCKEDLLDRLSQLEESIMDEGPSGELHEDEVRMQEFDVETINMLREMVEAQAGPEPEPRVEPEYGRWPLDKWIESLHESLPAPTAQHKREFETKIRNLVDFVVSSGAKNEVMGLLYDLGTTQCVPESLRLVLNLKPADLAEVIVTVVRASLDQGDATQALTLTLEVWGRARKEEGMLDNGLTWRKSHEALAEMQDALFAFQDRFGKARQRVEGILPSLSNQIAQEGVEKVLPGSGGVRLDDGSGLVAGGAQRPEGLKGWRASGEREGE